MAINRIEMAIDCDDPQTEGVQVLSIIAADLGLNPETDVAVSAVADQEGRPILFAVLAVGIEQEQAEEEELNNSINLPDDTEQEVI